MKVLGWLTSSLVCLDQARLQTWEPVSVHCRGWPVSVFQKRMQRSAVPPPEASRPCWWGDQAMAFTAAKCSVYCCTGRTLEWFHTSSYSGTTPGGESRERRHWCLGRGEQIQTPSLPTTHFVVVSTRGEQLVVCAPLESTDFLPVALETALWLKRRGSDVTLQDHSVAAPRRQLVGVPCQRPWPGRRKGGILQTTTEVKRGWRPRQKGRMISLEEASPLTHSSRVSFKDRELLPRWGVPDLYITFMSPHRHQVTLSTDGERLSMTELRVAFSYHNNAESLKCTLSDQPTDVTESPSTDRSHSRVTWTDRGKSAPMEFTE